MPVDTRNRRAAIIEIIRTQHVATQSELQKLLRARGHEVTQATLSRDLAQVGARRTSLPGGGSAYEVDGIRVRSPDAAQLGVVGDLVVGIRDAAALVVVHTRPGAAQAVAALLDQTRVPEVLGTIAGDDTIFVVPERRTPTRTLVRRLNRVFGIA
jgi:transcriptional regulator of arginine metabolism